MEKSVLKVALVGNPNVGKSSLFNQLTGLNQKVGNFPGITVDKKIGKFSLENNTEIELIDLPGTYSLYPKSLDEQVVPNILLDVANKDYPDIVIVVADVNNLKRNLLLFTEIKDLGLPTILAINMMDEVEKNGIQLDIKRLSEELDCPIYPVSARKNEGVEKLKNNIINIENPSKPFYNLETKKYPFIDSVKKICDEENKYVALHLFHQFKHIPFLSESQKSELSEIQKTLKFDSNLAQVEETLARYEKINTILLNTFQKQISNKTNEHKSNKIDKILTHRIFGLPIFMLLIFLVFQGIFSWAEYPMNWIESIFGSFQEFVGNILPAGWLTDLITDGVIAGLGGVVVFIPQIAILFAFITVLEETGYMARVTFMLDRVNRFFGLNGKSVVPLISSVACAVPAIMSARNIDNHKDRLITIFVAPFMSCSARIPVYVLLISLTVPDKNVLGFLNLQGLVMFSLYFLGLLAALLTALVMKFLLKSKQKSFFIMELPVYRIPRWKNVGQTILNKVNTFVVGAGKIIMIISVILWFLQNYGQGENYLKRKQELQTVFDKGYLSPEERDILLGTAKLEDSYAGKFGKFIEPGIKPLGFNWKIGISLITSFAAREVFTGTMATLYSTNENDEKGLKARMMKEINPETNKPYFTLAVALSLLVFYAFAMQCMSTLAVMKRETKSWKWPIIQMTYMTGLAYLSSFLVYNIFK